MNALAGAVVVKK